MFQFLAGSAPKDRRAYIQEQLSTYRRRLMENAVDYEIALAQGPTLYEVAQSDKPFDERGPSYDDMLERMQFGRESYGRTVARLEELLQAEPAVGTGETRDRLVPVVDKHLSSMRTALQLALDWFESGEGSPNVLVVPAVRSALSAAKTLDEEMSHVAV